MIELEAAKTGAANDVAAGDRYKRKRPAAGGRYKNKKTAVRRSQKIEALPVRRVDAGRPRP